MRLPQHPTRWVMTILFLALIGLTLWIAWAMNELEGRKATRLREPAGAESVKDAPPAQP